MVGDAEIFELCSLTLATTPLTLLNFVIRRALKREKCASPLISYSKCAQITRLDPIHSKKKKIRFESDANE